MEHNVFIPKIEEGKYCLQVFPTGAFQVEPFLQATAPTTRLGLLRAKNIRVFSVALPEDVVAYHYEMETELAAAKAELAAERQKRESLEKQNKELFPYYQDHLEGALIPATEYQKWIKRAEQAEAQCVATRAVIEYLSMRYGLCVQILPSGAWLVENKKQASEFAALEDKP